MVYVGPPRKPPQEPCVATIDSLLKAFSYGSCFSTVEKADSALGGSTRAKHGIHLLQPIGLSIRFFMGELVDKVPPLNSFVQLVL